MKALDNVKAIYDLTMNERCEEKVQVLFSNGLHKLMIDLIEELEELENRSCDSCICWDSVENSKLKTISYCRFLNTGTKNSFYCNEWENKHKITNF